MKLKEIEAAIVEELDEFGLAEESYLKSEKKTDLDRFISNLSSESIRDTENVYASLIPLAFEGEEIIWKGQITDIDLLNGRKPWIYLTHDV